MESNIDEDEELTASIAQLTINLGQIMKRLNMSSSGGVP